MSPPAEGTAWFGQVALDIADKPALEPGGSATWAYGPGGLVATQVSAGSQVKLPLPGNCLVDALVKLEPGAELALSVRE
ncbi:MAG: hypothetical protein HYU66_10200, partial [Armatimonadetes bacterium]|nr:hypothetical protein [Armatimonadota bacterium]